MDPTVLVTQATVAYYVAALIEWLKHASWFPLLKADMKRTQRWLSVFVAAAAALGINYSFDSAAGTLLITGLTLPTIGHGLIQFVMQEIAYTKFIQPPKNGGIPGTVELIALPERKDVRT